MLKFFLSRDIFHTVSHEVHLEIVNEILKISHDESKTSYKEILLKVDDLSKLLNELKINAITKKEFKTFKNEVMGAKKKKLAKSRPVNAKLRSQLLKIRLQGSKELRSPYFQR